MQALSKILLQALLHLGQEKPPRAPAVTLALLPGVLTWHEQHPAAVRAPWQRPALPTWVLNTELQRAQLLGDSVLSCALILVGVSCVATLLLAVPEEPAGAEAGATWGTGHGQAAVLAAGEGRGW